MIENLNYYCSLVKWFIMGGVRPLNIDNEQLSEKDNKVYANWSKAEYQSHFSNAASNVGLMNEAREYWNEQPLEYRKKKEKQWEKRNGKNWRKHVVL